MSVSRANDTKEYEKQTEEHRKGDVMKKQKKREEKTGSDKEKKRKNEANYGHDRSILEEPNIN